jgi:hypothetical protein
LLFKILTGQTEDHLVSLPWSGSVKVHSEIVPALERLGLSARDAGFDLQVASGFRGFERQLGIWNAKARGERAVLDECGRPLDFSDLTPEQRMFAILRWSALPGASRHHWGTDIDVFALNALPEGYRLQLSVEEHAAGGVLAPFHAWLDGVIEGATGGVIGCEGFFRPYVVDGGGVLPERWHLSYAPIARDYERDFTLGMLESVVRGAEIELKAEILAALPEIFRRFVRGVGG